MVTIRTDGNPQSAEEDPALSNSSLNDSAVVSTAVPTSVAAAANGNGVLENTVDATVQEETDENEKPTSAKDQSLGSEEDLAQIGGAQAVQSVLMLATPSAAVVAVKAKAGSSSNASVAEVAAIGDAGQQTTQLGRPIPMSAKSYSQFAPGIGTKGSTPAQSSAASDPSGQGGVQLSGEWDVIPSHTSNTEISDLSPDAPNATKVAPGREAIPGPAFNAANKASKMEILPDALNTPAPVSASGEFATAIIADQNAGPVANGSEGDPDNSSVPLERMAGSVQSVQQLNPKQDRPVVEPALPSASYGLVSAASADGPISKLQSQSASSPQAEADTVNSKAPLPDQYPASPIIKKPSISPESRLALINATAAVQNESWLEPVKANATVQYESRLAPVNTNTAIDPNGTAPLSVPETLTEPKVMSKEGSSQPDVGVADLNKAATEPGAETSFSNSVNLKRPATSNAAARQTESSVLAASSPARSQDLQQGIRKPHNAARSALLHGERVRREVTQKDGATAGEPVELQIPQAEASDAQGTKLPSLAVLGSPGVPARSNSKGHTSEAKQRVVPQSNGANAKWNSETHTVTGVQNGFPRLSSSAGEASRATMLASMTDVEMPAQHGTIAIARPSDGPADPKTASLRSFAHFPASASIAEVNSSEPASAGSLSANPSLADQPGTVQPTGDESKALEQVTGGTPRNGSDVTPEKTARNELPAAKPLVFSERLPATDSAARLAVPTDTNAARPDSAPGNTIGKQEIRFPRLNRSADRSGIVDAQHIEHMVSTKDYEPHTELAGKNMPNSGKNDSPSRNGVRALAANELNRARVDSSAERMADLAISSRAWLDSTEQARSTEGTLTSVRAEAHLHARLTERIWSAVETFRSAGSNDWVVRIRPDQETELNLRLKMQENQLVIHAKLENGNWDALAPSWRDLQVYLANRGVQLQPLEGSSDRSAQNFNPMNSEPQNQRQQTGEDGRDFRDLRELDFRFAQEVPERKKPHAAVKPAKSGNGWESWA